MDTIKKFVIKKPRLQDLFPIQRETKLTDQFPIRYRPPCIGSGFLNSNSITVATPTFIPPIPNFTVTFGNEIRSSSNVSPGTLYEFQQGVTIRPFVLTNTTDGTTYTSLQWTVSQLPTKNTQAYTITPGNILITYEVRLQAFYKNVEGSAYMKIQSKPTLPIASINGSSLSTLSPFGTVTQFDIIPFTFTNTSTGYYTSLIWSATNIVFSSTTNAQAAGTVQVLLGQLPVIVTLSLYIGVNLVSTVSQTTVWNNVKGLNYDKTMTNNVALVQLNPLPQALAVAYSGVQVLWIPTVAGQPAQEPTKYRIQRLVDPLQGSFKSYQGRNNNASRLLISLDTALTPPSSTENYNFFRFGNGNNNFGSIDGVLFAPTLSDSMSYTFNLIGGAATQINNPLNVAKNDTSPCFFNQLPNTVKNFDAFSCNVHEDVVKLYKTAYELYESNSLGLSTILSNTNYFGVNTGRFRLILENAIVVTFSIPVGQRIVALITGGLRVNGTSTIWGIPTGSGYASLYNLTSFVVSNKISFSKVTGETGSVIGFYIFKGIGI